MWTADGYRVDELRYAPDGRTLIVILSKRLKDGRLYQFRHWDAVTWTERSKFFQIDPEPLKIIYSPFLAVSKDSRMAGVRYNYIRFTREGGNYRESPGCYLHVFDLSTGNQLWAKDVSGWESYGMAFSPDDGTIATGHTRRKKSADDAGRHREFEGEVWLWDSRSGSKKSTLPGGPYQLVGAIQYSDNGKDLVFADEHRGKEATTYFYLWNLLEQKPRLRVRGANQGAVSPDGKLVATSTDKEGIKVLDVASAKQKASLPINEEQGWISKLLWSPDAKTLFVTHSRGRVWRWDLFGGGSYTKVDSVLPEVEKKARRNAYEQDLHLPSRLCAIGVNAELPERLSRRNLPEDYAELQPPEIVLLDLKTMQRRGMLTGHRGQVTSLAFSPDGKTLLSGGTDGTVRSWSLASLTNQLDSAK
jgi:WD40 repeat protein